MYKNPTTQFSFLYTGPYIYDNLPYEIRDYTNCIILKQNLSNWLLKQIAYISSLL